MMRIGGCGAETACDSSIYFALHRGLAGIAPENAASITKDAYIRFAYEMKPYLSPRMSGIDRLDIYMEGYAQYLILNHRSKALHDYVWHWFLINGYDDTNGSFLVKAVTYSKYEWLDFQQLWNTGHERRGGLVLYHLD